MTHWVVLNGRLVPYELAVLPVEDRGLIFSDAVYEVVRYYGGRPFCLEDHLDRLEQSAASLHLPLPVPRERLARWMDLSMERNQIRDGAAYVQITRGAHPRDHAIPEKTVPNWFIVSRPIREKSLAEWERGTRLISMPDIRWQYRDVKSTSLLGNVLAKDIAKRQGKDDTVFVVDGCLTEATSANLFGWYREMLWTYPLGREILPGITRKVVLSLARRMNLTVREAPLPLADWYRADEIFLAGTVAEILPAVEIDGRPVGRGTPGPVTRRIKQAFDRHKRGS